MSFRDANNSRIVMSDLRGSVVAVAPLLGTGAPSTTAARDFDAWGKEITTTTSSKPKHAFVGFEPDRRRLDDPALRSPRSQRSKAATSSGSVQLWKPSPSPSSSSSPLPGPGPVWVLRDAPRA